MTVKQENSLYKHAAKEACAENGINVAMSNMVLLEGAYSESRGCTYVMFRDRKTCMEWQCRYSADNYTVEHRSFWSVQAYVEFTR